MDDIKPNTSDRRRGNLDAPTLKWEDTITSVRAQDSAQGVALVGFAESSRHLAPFDDLDIEIWALNESYASDYLKTSEGKFRTDRWFQMHLEEDWSRTNNPNDPKHPEWLGLEHNFPVYMQEEFPGVPSAVKFPLEELNQEFFGTASTINPETGKSHPWLEVYPNGYYTSSFAYIMALAIYLKMDPIQIWGFNMGTKSEYMYQKPGGEFWVAQALSRGLHVEIAGNSPIMQGSLYGYETSNILLPTQVDARKTLLESDIEPAKEEVLQYYGARQELQDMLLKKVGDPEVIDNRLRTRQQSELAASCKVNFYLGSISEAKMYMKHFQNRHDDTDEPTGFVDRLTLEVRLVHLRKFVENLRAQLEQISGAKIELIYTIKDIDQPMFEDLMRPRILDLRNAEIQAANRLNFYLGAISQTEEFMFRSESRAPTVSDEYDFGFMIVPELFPADEDLLTWEVKEENYEPKKTKKSEEIEDGTAGDPELPSESAQRSFDQSVIQRPADRDKPRGGGDWPSTTEDN